MVIPLLIVGLAARVVRVLAELRLLRLLFRLVLRSVLQVAPRAVFRVALHPQLPLRLPPKFPPMELVARKITTLYAATIPQALVAP